MEKFYTEQERNLIKGVQLLENKQKLNALLELDMALLALEEQQGLLDGLKMEVYLL